MAAIFITGNSNGRGPGLTRYYLQQGERVYRIGRRAVPLKHDRLHRPT